MKHVMVVDIAETIDFEIEQPSCQNYKYLYLLFLYDIQEWIRTKLCMQRPWSEGSVPIILTSIGRTFRSPKARRTMTWTFMVG